MEIINWRILAHPMNWAIVFMMVFIFALAVHLVFGVKMNFSPKGNAQ